MERYRGLPIFAFSTVAAWRRWLHTNHAREDGLWLKLAKKDSGVKSVTYVQAREVAITYGWIDGLLNRIDETHYAIRFTPRRPRSKWSKINRGIAEELIASEAMQPAGFAEVQRAKADGRWEAAYDSPSTIKVPEDFVAALESSPRAHEFFEAMSKSNRYAILFRIHDAKRPETRAKRIQQFIAMLEREETIHEPGVTALAVIHRRDLRR